MKVAVLIPCYNEHLTIEKVINDFRDVLPEADIYVYDNNSTDSSFEVAKNAKGKAIVRREYKQGKGNVIRTAFREIEADVYIMVDADDTYPAESAKEMSEIISSGQADMCVGDRLSSTYFTENKRQFHNFGNRLVRFFINLLWRPKVPVFDVMTGFRAFSPLFVKSFPILSHGFELETEMTIHALDKNFTIANLPIQYRDRQENSFSKLNTYSDGFKVLLTIINLFKNYKPLPFFLLISFLFMLFGSCLFIPVFVDFLKTGLVPKIPSLVMSVLFYILSFLSLVCGLILDTVVKNDRQNSEIQMNILEILLKNNK